jgi:cob(I)alamin adenosyltransferase
MKIYTKTGDKGQTSLFDGTRVYKNNKRVYAYGTIDELNSMIGVVISYLGEKENIKKILSSVQYDLFNIGAILANPSISKKEVEIEEGNLKRKIKRYEKIIDNLTLKMPELTQFILPGGGKVGAFLHVARTICRRAEREVITFSKEESVHKVILQYLNRLSDLLFIISRFMNWKEGKKEIIWTKKIAV